MQKKIITLLISTSCFMGLWATTHWPAVTAFSANSLIVDRNSFFRKDHLPDVQIAAPEGTGTALEIVFPHAVKCVVVEETEFIPVGMKIMKPAQKSWIIKRSKGMPVLDNK